jgi:hypothetical protein
MRFYDYKISTLKSWKKFQKMVCELFREIWQDPHAQEFGREGQKQDGIDILGKRKGSKIHEAVQSTTETPLTKDKVKKDYENSKKLDLDLDCFIIATTSRRDAKIQKYAASLSERGPYRCVVWFWEDIIDYLADHEDIRKKYFPGYIFIKTVGDSSGKLVEVNDETSRWVLLITRLTAEHPHYRGMLLISDLLSYTCQTYRIGDHWSRLVLDDYIKPEYQRCVGGNKYGAFLLSKWLNSFKSDDEILSLEKERYVFKLTSKQKKEFHEIMVEQRED